MGMIAAIFLFIFFPELLKPITEPEPEVTDNKPQLTSYADVIAQASDSVVNIRRFNIDTNYFYPNRTQLRVSGGSGVLISDAWAITSA